MISWIQKTFQQHFRIVFGVLLVLIIVAFVFVTNVSSGLGSAERKALKTPFFDLNLGSREDVEKITRDAGIAINLQYGMSADSIPQFQEIALSRYAALYTAQQLRVPAPTKPELAEYIKTLRAFAGPDGQFDAKKYDEFRKTVSQGKGVTEAQISRVLSDNLRIERVNQLVAGPGYALPADVKRELSLADTSWTLTTATLDRASFTPSITPTEAELTKYFEENALNYTIPAQVSVSYVEFNADAYLASLPAPAESDVRGFYDNNVSRFPVPDRKPGEVANPDADYAKVRPQVEAALKRSAAIRLAATAAGDAAVALYDKKLTPGSAEFSAFLAQNKLTLKDVPPFSQANVPAELGANPAIPTEALKLSKDRVVSDAIPTEKGSVILFWKDSIPSRQPTFTEVRAKVSADYIENEKTKRFVALGQALRTQIQARLKAGDTFEKAASSAAAAAGVKVETKTLPAFTLRQPPQDFNQELYGLLQNLQKGEVSEMSIGGDKPVIAYAQDKKLPDLSETNPQYTSVRTRIAQMNAAGNAQAYFRDLVSQELAKSTPVDR
jgi:peptidyl-prolyl cis-trans isomerase D